MRGIATRRDGVPSGPIASVLKKSGLLLDRVRRGLRLAAVGGIFEQHAVRAVLRVRGLLMFHVRGGAGLVVLAKQLHFAAAILAAELRIAVTERGRDTLHLPERLIPSAVLD